MEWTKVSISTSPDKTDFITAILYGHGIHGTEVFDAEEREAFLINPSSNWDYIDESLLSSSPENTNVTIVFYLGTDAESISLLTNIKAELSFFNANLHAEIVNDTSWVNEWKKYFEPIRIGRVLVIPEWIKTYEKRDSDIIFTLDPGSAFGTGQHATTSLCIEALQNYIQPDDYVLDIGCGSGILSIISLLLGAQHVICCDIDPAAVETTKRNAEYNPINLNQLEAYVGDILTNMEIKEKIAQKTYNIISANIVADVIIQLAPVIPKLLRPGAHFIASGVITERLQHVLDALIACGMSILETKSNEGWCCVVATHG